MRLSFSPIGNYYLVAILAIVLVALLFLGPARSRITPRRRWVLIGLRLAVIMLVLLAMLRPALVHTQTIKQSASVILLGDRSRSMQVADAAGKKTRWDALRAAIDDAWPTLKELQAKKELEVKFHLFDVAAESDDELSADRPDLGAKPEGQQTAIGAVLDDTLKAAGGKRLIAMILLSDGAQNAIAPREAAPQTAARAMADQGVPLYTVPFGQARGVGQARDIAVTDLLAPETVFVKNQLEVAGRVRIDGYVNQNITVQLLFETKPGKMEPVGAQQLQAREDGARLPIALDYVPVTPGEYKVTLRATPQSGEVVTANNEISTFISVLKGGLNVLYIEGAARVEQKFLRRSLDASPDIKIDYLKIDARNPNTKPVDLIDRFKPGKYDVYLFGDIDSAAFTKEELEQLAKTVDTGAGFMMLGGFHSFGPGGYGNTPLAQVLPILIDRLERQNFNEPIRSDLQIGASVRMKPTKIGETQSLMQLGSKELNDAAWARLPLLDGANIFRGVKLDAKTLAQTDEPKPRPLLVSQDFGNGRVLAFAADSTWHWWMGGYEALHRRFWRQTILWLAKKDQSDEGRVWIEFAKRRFSPGEPVKFKVLAKGADGHPLSDVTYKAEVRLPDGRAGEPRLRREEDHSVGEFRDARQAGDYVVHVQATHAGQSLGSTQARFLVYEQDLEMDNPAADRGLMENLATITSGKTVAPEQLPALLKEIQAAANKLEVETETKSTLWDTWAFFLLFVCLIALEWFLRKRWGLV
jgi:uncharacterized membrane protein